MLLAKETQRLVWNFVNQNCKFCGWKDCTSFF